MLTGRDGLLDGFGNNPGSRPLHFNKAGIANNPAGSYTSMWRATGWPLQADIPTVPAACQRTTKGALPNWANPTPPERTYVGLLDVFSPSAAGGNCQLYDRLAHMGGLSGTVFTPTVQTVGLDLQALSGTANLLERIGSADYSQVFWGIEWYLDTGASTPNVDLGVTMNDGSPAVINMGALPNATMRAGRFLPFYSQTHGLYIRSVDTLTLSGTTGTAGNFGITATRYLCSKAFLGQSSAGFANCYEVGIPPVDNDAALFAMMLSNSTGNSGAIGHVGIVQK